MTVKPKIGVLLITSGWFRDVGLQQSGSSLTAEVDDMAREIVVRLSAFCEPVCRGVVYSEADAAAAAVEFISAEVDGLVISSLMWCEDQILRAALTRLHGLPCVVCTFLPYKLLPETVSFENMLRGSGSVASLQISGFLKREGYNYQSLSGYYRDEEVYRELADHCRAFGIRRRLRGARCGVLPFRCDQMSTTYVDEFDLRKQYGIELRYLELQRFREAAAAVSADDIGSFITKLEQDGVVIDVDRKNLEEGVKYALSVERIAAEERLDILAMNDIIDEMHRCFGLRPCLSNKRMSGSGIVVSMEADIAAGIAMFLLREYTGETPFYSEVFTADFENNALLMGHAGYHDSNNRDERYPVRVISDAEYKNSDPFTGACTYFKYKPGPVTAVNCVYNGERLQWVVFEGESLSGPPKLEGNCHLFCRPGLPVGTFYERAIEIGVSQHWVVVGGHWKARLEKLCRWLGIRYYQFP